MKKETQYPIISYSWKILNLNVAIKEMDKSSFLHHGTAIPKDIRDFFIKGDIEKGTRIDTCLFYKGKEYDAHIESDLMENPRTRLFWSNEFADLVIEKLPEWYECFLHNRKSTNKVPIMRFEKNALSNGFEVEIIEPSIIEKDFIDGIDDDTSLLSEGTIKHITSKKYEREPLNRRKAIEIHGKVCGICGFDFEEVYGERGRGFIEIHHIRPLYSLDREMIINPAEDLIPVCSNCHRMIHRRKENILSIDEMKKLLKK
ncbi:MAG: HNH endonuclease [Acetobacterium sp.]|uniref:HNH endonuclease n=1 Tax=Acetobacterium sp. TaxID=1872094 RepID=UPI003242F4E2